MVRVAHHAICDTLQQMSGVPMTPSRHFARNVRVVLKPTDNVRSVSVMNCPKAHI